MNITTPLFLNLPRQKISKSKKTNKWAIDTVEAIISNSNFQPGRRGYRDLMKQAYDYYNGIIDDDDYTHVMQPYGKTRSNFPARLHNYPIIKPVIDLLLGEKRKRPINFVVTVANPDAVTKKEESIKAQVLENLKQNFINEMARQGNQVEGSLEDVQLPEALNQELQASYQDSRAIRGQQSMNYMMQKLRLKNEFNKGWFHFLVSGVAITYRDVVGNEPYFEVLNPLEVDYEKSTNTEFIEDGEWAVYRRLAQPSKVLDLYYDQLSSKQVDRIERPRNNRADNFLLYADYDNIERDQDRLVEVMEVCWKSMKKIGICTFVDENGEYQEMEVEEGYKAGPEENCEWFWVNEVWGGVRIDGDIFIKMEPIPIQRTSIDNPSICKLPINGRKYSDINSPNISMVLLGIPYQLNYNIYKYRLEVAIAKSKDVIASFDINMMPKGWDMDKWMYYLDATGIAWSDYAKEGIKLNPQHQTVLDLSITTIAEYTALLESVKAEYMELSGVNRQRLGGVTQYDGKATTEQSIVQSSHITEDMFAKFAELEQRDLQALIDLSKYAWINGKKAMYILSDMSQTYLEIDGIDHMESEYGIFVSDAARDVEKVQMIQQLSQAMAQNGSSISTIIDIIDATNIPQIKAQVKKAEAAAQQLQQAQQQAEADAAQAKQELDMAVLDRESEENQKDRDNKIEVALIQAEAQRTLAELNIGSMGDEAAEDLARETLTVNTQLEREKLAMDRDLGNKKAESDRIKAKASMKSASRPVSSGAKK